MSEAAARPPRSFLDGFLRFGEHRRDTIAGVTTFIVMSYIIVVDPAILGFAGRPAGAP